MSVLHTTFTVERTFPKHSADRVFNAFKDPEKRRRWFVEGDGFTIHHYRLAFRVGEHESGAFSFGDGPRVTSDTYYLDIVDNERLVFAYAMTVGGRPLSSSLATIEFVAAGVGSKLTYTEQAVFIDGKVEDAKGREEGMGEAFERLAAELER